MYSPLGDSPFFCFELYYIWEIAFSPRKDEYNEYNWLCIKVGRGQGDKDIGTRVWGLGTWGRETRDLRTSTMGRRDVWDGDAGTSNVGDAGGKVGGKRDISLSS